MQVSTDHTLTIFCARLCPGLLLCPWSVALASRHVHLVFTLPCACPTVPSLAGHGAGLRPLGCRVAGALSVEGAGLGWGEVVEVAHSVGVRVGRMRGHSHSLVLMPPGFLSVLRLYWGGTSPLGVSPLLAQTSLSSVITKTIPVPLPPPTPKVRACALPCASPFLLSGHTRSSLWAPGSWRVD